MGDYREFLLAAGLADGTVRNYELRLRQALEWCRQQDVELITANPAQLAALASDTWRRTHTVLGQARAALIWYFRMEGIDRVGLGAIRPPSQPKMRNRALSPHHAALLDKTTRGLPPEGIAVLMGLYLGMRVQEIASAEWDRFDPDPRGVPVDVDDEDQLIIWYSVLGKGSRTRHLPVHPVLHEELLYMRRRGRWLFPGRFGDHIHQNTVWAWTKRLAVQAGIGDITTHQLRHTAITEIYDRTGDLVVAQEFAGHASPSTTRGYTRLNQRRLVTAVRRMNFQAPASPSLGYRWEDPG